jgi:hypothetical protein
MAWTKSHRGRLYLWKYPDGLDEYPGSRFEIVGFRTYAQLDTANRKVWQCKMDDEQLHMLQASWAEQAAMKGERPRNW